MARPLGLRDTFIATSPAEDIPYDGVTAEDVARAGASQFKRGLRSAGIADEAGAAMQASLEAAARGDRGAAVELRAQAEALANQAAQWSPHVTSTADVTDVGTARDLTAGMVGSGLRSTVPSLVGGTAAVLGARFGGLRRVGQAIAGAAGAGVPAYGMEKREAVMSAAADPTIMATRTPDEILDAANVKAGVNAFGEAIVPAGIALRTLGTAARVARPTLRGIGKNLAGDVVKEGATEAAQELVGQGTQSYLNPERDTSGDDQRILDAAVSGAITAPFLGAPGHALDAARLVAQNVRERAVQPVVEAVQPVVDKVAEQPIGTPFDFLDGLTDGGMTRAREAWMNRVGERAPADIAAQGVDAVTSWLKEQDEKRHAFVGELMRNDPDAGELGERYAADPRGTFAEAAGYLTRKHGTARAAKAVDSLADAAESFHRGLTGKEPKKSERYGATDRALFDLFRQPLLEAGMDEATTVKAADLLRRFARGTIEPKLGLRAARTMMEAYGDNAMPMAVEAAAILQRDGADPKVVGQLPRLLQSILNDESNRQEVMTAGLDPLVSNRAREHFQQAKGRPFGHHELATVAERLDALVRGEASPADTEGLHEVFGERLEQAVNVARAVHDARHRDVSTFTREMGGPVDEEDGADERTDFDDRQDEKTIEKSAPTLFSMRRGEPDKVGGGTPFDRVADAGLINERREALRNRYPGADVVVVPAAQYAKLQGVDPAALGGKLDGKVVLQITRPTNEDVLDFDRESVQRLLEPREVVRGTAASDEKRGERYFVNKATGMTTVRNPGSDEGAFFVALANDDGSPQISPKTGKRVSRMIRADRLVAEMRKRDKREGVTTSEKEGGERDLSLLLAGLGSLATAQGTGIDTKAGLVFLSSDGKRHTVALAGAQTKLPADLKIGRTTVGEILAARRKHEDSARQADIKAKALEVISTADKGSVDELMERAREASMETEELTPGTELMAHVDSLVQKHGFPANLRANLTIEQKAALSTQEAWSRYVDSVLGTSGAKRRLHDFFYTEKGYTRLTPKARALRDVLPELERRAEMVRKGEKIDLETGLQEQNDTDNTKPVDRGEAKLNPDEELGYRTRTQIGSRAKAEGGSTAKNDHDDGENKLEAAKHEALKKLPEPKYIEVTREEVNTKDRVSTTKRQIPADDGTSSKVLGGAAVSKTKPTGTDDRRPGLDAGETQTTGRKGAIPGTQEMTGRAESFLRALRKRSEEMANDRPLTDEEQQAIRDYVKKTLGPKIKVEFAGELGHAGEWDQDANTIRIALTTGVNGMSVASHEALHGFFTFLVKNGREDVVDTLTSAAGGTAVRKQLERLLANEPAALKQLRDPEERAAYMYQFWVASQAGLVDFHVGPKTEGTLKKIAAFFRKVLGIVTAEEKAVAIMQAFHDGKMTKPSAALKVIEKLHEGEKVKTLRHSIGRQLSKVGSLALPAYDNLVNSGNGAAAKVAEAFYTDPTSTEKGQGFLNARSQQAAIWLNKFSTVLANTSQEDMVVARDVLQGKTTHVTNGEVARVVNLTRQMLKEFLVYMHAAGVNVRERRNYFPRVWEMEKIIADTSGFEAKLLEHHRDELEKLGDIALKAAQAQWKAEQELGRETAKPKPEDYTAEKTAKHIVATLSSQGGYVADDVDAGKAKISEDAMRPGFTPFMAAVNGRTLDFLDMEVFHEYLKEDMVNIVSTYLMQGVRRAEYARRFGNGGERLADMMDDVTTQETARVRSEMRGADEQEVSEEVSARVAKYARAVMAMEGTLGYDISPTLRRINSGMLVYQNLRVLPLSIFSSLIDPMGVMVRGGTARDAFDTFKRGIAEISRSWFKDGDTQDQATKMAELMGTVDNKLMLDALGETYSSIYLYGWAKRLNEKLFQWNGMEAWNRSMRVGATQAAIGFITRHAKGDGAHSERWLAELGLTKDDVHLNPDGSMKIFREEGLSTAQADKIRVAVQRWVDSAVLRPNAAQRPAWASDPHYALIFHLKQFTYSFHQVILKRAAHEWVNGNVTPGLALLSYVPFMLAADLAKGLLQGGGDEPRWKEGWTVSDYTVSAVQRAGLLGIGQFAVDAKNMGLSTLGGPAIEQVSRAIDDPAYNTFVRSLPGNPAYRDALL